MAVLEVNGCRLRCREWGAGAPLICLHGGMGIDGSYLDCAALRRLANEGIRVIVPDQRGHGRSGRTGEATYTHATWVEDVGQLADRLGLDRFALMGHSYGGFIALEFALRHGHRLGHLVLVGSSAGPVDSSRFAVVADDRELRDALRRRWPSLFAAEEKHWPVFERLRFSAAAYNAAFRRELPRYDLTDWLGELRVRTLLISGSRDGYAQDMKRMLSRIPGARLEIIEEAGHMPFLEAPERFTRMLAGFLGEP